MKNKNIAMWLTVSLVLAIITALADDGSPSDTLDFFYTAAGLGLVVFGGIAAYKLNKLND